MSSNIIFGFVISVCLAFVGGVWLVGSAWNITHLKDSIAACEKDLPRSQKCELIAVVKK